jgi:hypothetical protein
MLAWESDSTADLLVDEKVAAWADQRAFVWVVQWEVC